VKETGCACRVGVAGCGLFRCGHAEVSLYVFDRVVVEDEGQGDPVVFLHGLGGSSNTWTPLMAFFFRHRVIRIDLPGSGRSHRAEGTLSIPRYVECALTVCERLGIARAHWVGHSLGTIVCQHLAVVAPARVRSLSLLGPVLAPADTARAAIRERARKAFTEGQAGMHAISEALVRTALSAHTRESQPIAVAFVRESLMRSDPDGYARSCEALADAEAAAVEQIRAPVLLVTGDEDGVAPPQSVRGLAGRLQGASRVEQYILPRCGHWTPVERPAECGQYWTQFVAAAVRA